MLHLKGYGIDSSSYAREYVLVFGDFFGVGGLGGGREKLKIFVIFDDRKISGDFRFFNTITFQ